MLEAYLARAWEEVRSARDARWRKNAWCLASLVILMSASVGLPVPFLDVVVRFASPL